MSSSPPRKRTTFSGLAWGLALLWALWALPAQSAPAAPQPVLRALKFVGDVPAPDAAADFSSTSTSLQTPVVYACHGSHPGIRARLLLPAATDSLTIRVVSSQPGLGTARQTVAGAAGTATLELPFQPAAAPAGVGATDLELRWEYRTATVGWTRFALTHHRLYWVLNAPGAPWATLPPTPASTALWLGMLEISGPLAAGATTAEQAAAAVTGYVYGRQAGASGPTKFQYNPMLPDANLTHLDPGTDRYVVLTDELRALLASLNNPAMTHLQLNCYDAAACVVMLGNALGCRLQRVKVNSAYYLVTHKLVPMGFTKPAKADFRVHCVAWSGPLDERGLVYDACFAQPPAAEAAAAEPLANLTFGSPKQPGSYVERVFTNKEDFYLTPLPALIIRQ